MLIENIRYNISKCFEIFYTDTRKKMTIIIYSKCSFMSSKVLIFVTFQMGSTKALNIISSLLLSFL